MMIQLVCYCNNRLEVLEVLDVRSVRSGLQAAQIHWSLPLTLFLPIRWHKGVIRRVVAVVLVVVLILLIVIVIVIVGDSSSNRNSSSSSGSSLKHIILSPADQNNQNTPDIF